MDLRFWWTPIADKFHMDDSMQYKKLSWGEQPCSPLVYYKRHLGDSRGYRKHLHFSLAYKLVDGRLWREKLSHMEISCGGVSSSFWTLLQWETC